MKTVRNNDNKNRSWPSGSARRLETKSSTNDGRLKIIAAIVNPAVITKITDASGNL